MSELSRRKFLSLLAVAPVVPYIFIKEAAAEIVATVDFGFTFGKVTAPPGFDEIIRNTLRSRAPELVNNLTKNNTLFLRLEENKYVQVNKIDPEAQKARIIKALDDRRMDNNTTGFTSTHTPRPIKQEDLWISKEETKEEYERSKQLYECNKNIWHSTAHGGIFKPIKEVI